MIDIYNFIRSVNEYRIFKLARGKEVPSELLEITSSEQLPEHDNLFCFLSAHLKELTGDVLFGKVKI